MSSWPLFRIVARWYIHSRFTLSGRLFEYRHYRRLIPLVVILSILAVFWSFLVLGVGILVGGFHLIWQQSFAQNVVASLLVLPLSLAIGVVVGTVIQKHALRFQVRHAGDRLGDGVRLAAFKFIIFLQRACKIPINLAGPDDSRFVRRAREIAHQSFAEVAWSFPLPPDFQLQLDETVDAIASCFRDSPDLRIAFPRSFDLMDRLDSIIRGIKADSRSDLHTTALIVLSFAEEMIRDIEG